MTLPTSGRASGEDFRRFTLLRHKDESGTSGTGIVAEGVQFSNGKCCLSWLTNYTSVAVYESLNDVLKIHGHSGYTEVIWIDNNGPCYQRP
jgi:hypothetical protein